MCGIVGLFRPEGVEEEWAGAVVDRMASTLRHRGPDDAGVWIDAPAGIALGHRRLSILELSALGHQPMSSAGGRYCVTFNGEIYNFRELRETLSRRGHRFRGRSDTEVLLAAIEEWGMEGALERCNGMFALGVWDREERVLSLARDRAGEKPLFYGWVGQSFVFASELKALRAHPGFDAEVDRDVLPLYLKYSCIPAPYSIYRGIRKLPPGTLLTVRGGTRDVGTPVSYWPPERIAAAGAREPFDGDEADAARELERLLLDSVRMQMEADVPLGALLSGGVDSSTVVALMQAQRERPVRTFTIGCEEAGYDETEYARAVARHLGTDHTELRVSARDALEVIPRLPVLYDEPFADSSQIPAFLVCRLAREQVKVVLSGDGGDELFGGYERYRWGRGIWRGMGWIPLPARRALARVLGAVPRERWERVVSALPFVPRRLGRRTLGTRASQLAEVLPSRTPEEVYGWLASGWRGGLAEVLRGAREPDTFLSRPERWPELRDFQAWMMFADTVTDLPDDLLVKMDRASMAVGLEGRMPLLDPRVMEFAWRLPTSLKIRGREGKWILRQVLYRYVPRGLIERPKMGFSIPVASWLRGPLREWAEELLDARRLDEAGMFSSAPIRARWESHLSGACDWSADLWGILMFQAWQAESQVGRSAHHRAPARRAR